MLVKKDSLAFVQTHKPTERCVTKFGGQPTWWDEPQWPLSRATGHPMRFICQIALDPDLFGDIPGRMAYLFMTDEENDVDGTWQPEGGENALLIQPGRYDGPAVSQRTGPTLEGWIDEEGTHCLAPVEYTVQLTRDEDPDVYDKGAAGESESEVEALEAAWSENKLGGTPTFLQFPEYPADGPWRLLIQLSSTDVPFNVNFGDAGIGYGFLSQDSERGRFLWQCL